MAGEVGEPCGKCGCASNCSSRHRSCDGVITSSSNTSRGPVFVHRPASDRATDSGYPAVMNIDATRDLETVAKKSCRSMHSTTCRPACGAANDFTDRPDRKPFTESCGGM